MRPDSTPTRADLVSIPFKREGAWKAYHRQKGKRQQYFKFQFPSNGKEHGKFTKCAARARQL